MGGKVASQPAARTTPARKPPAAKKVRTSFTSHKVRTTFTPARVQTTFTPSRIKTTFTPAGVSTTFTRGASRNARYAREDAFLADPARTRDSKIYLLKRLMRGDGETQRVALKHLAKPAWIHYLKTHDNKLVRLVERISKTEISMGDFVDDFEGNRVLAVENIRRAQSIWRQVANAVRVRRMKSFISDRCDFHDRALNVLDKKGLERLFKSVTSFRPPRECRR